MKIRIGLFGIDALTSGLVRLVKTTEQIGAVTQKNGAEMQQKAQQNAPVDTGYLKRNVTLTMTDSNRTATVRSEASYAGYQEWGTRYQPGTPHVGPAFNEQAPKYKEDMRKLIWK